MRWLTPWLLFACTPDGPPAQTDMAFRLAPARVEGEHIDWVTASFDVRALRLRSCDAPSVVLDWPTVPASSQVVPLPADRQPWTVGLSDPIRLLGRRRPDVSVGPWCGLDVVTSDGHIVAEGFLPSTGADLTLSVSLPDLVGNSEVGFAEVSIDAVDLTASVDAFVVELGADGWLAPVEAALLAGEGVDVTAGSEAATTMLDGLLSGAALYVDLDDDGRLQAGERDEGPVLGLAPVGVDVE